VLSYTVLAAHETSDDVLQHLCFHACCVFKNFFHLFYCTMRIVNLCVCLYACNELYIRAGLNGSSACSK
jgi:hypothetical protein